MDTPLTIQLNGQKHLFSTASSPTTLAELIESLELKPDRIAVEKNGEIVPRSGWGKVEILHGDRLEIVHFVGGGRGES